MLVAVVILGIVLGAMARSLTTSLFSAQGQERQVQATAQLQHSMEAVHGVAWEDAGLCDSAVTSHFGGSTYTHADGTVEPIVILDDTDESCADPVLVPRLALEREGVDYTVDTVISWTDDPNDDVSGTDPNSPQDLKHVLVTVAWEHRGEARTVSNETYLAPNALEQPIRTQVEHTTGASYTYLSAADNLTKSNVYLRAFTVVPQQAIHVEWARMDGSSVGPQPMENVNGRGTEWRLLIPDGSPEFTINKLANGETLFRFTATDAATAETASTLDRGLFLIEQSGHTVSWIREPTSVRVRTDGVACDLPVAVSVSGALRSDLVSVEWTNGPTETGLSSTSVSSTGASFGHTFSGETAFTVGTTDITVTADRVADGHRSQLVKTGIPVEEVASC
jgi:hypothetical protein